MHLFALALVALLMLPSPVATQEVPHAQPATTDAPFSITFEAGVCVAAERQPGKLDLDAG